MCGIVGLLARSRELEPTLGQLFVPMLTALTSRGPDSAGFALYDRTVPTGSLRWSLCGEAAGSAVDWRALTDRVETESGSRVSAEDLGAVCFLTTDAAPELVRGVVAAFGGVSVVGFGAHVRLIKDVGTPAEICGRYGITSSAGYLAVGHTRMATESAVTTLHSHPFSPAPDVALVHNGSFSNHATIRRRLADVGITCETDNDSEVAACYIGWRLQRGDDLQEALRHVLKEFDGFFTLAVGAGLEFAVVRDAFACKPLVVAETAEYIATASEYQALAELPGIENARVFEPGPEEISTWTVDG